ncbi:MAG: hypothetical protein ABIN96_18375 [Rubrivivax sp.]
MLGGLKRWFGGATAEPGADAWPGIRSWACAQRHTFKQVPDAGFVIDGRLSAPPWRLEWGPSQRSYLSGAELRLRCELRVGTDLQALVMNRALQESLEAWVFDQFIEGVQTRIDTETPPEARWLVLFPKLAGAAMPLPRDRYIALSSVNPWLLRWLDGPLTDALTSRRDDPQTPFVLMVGRGRLALRTAAPNIDLPTLQRVLQLFECAAQQAQRATR